MNMITNEAARAAIKARPTYRLLMALDRACDLQSELMQFRNLCIKAEDDAGVDDETAECIVLYLDSSKPQGPG